HVNNEIAIEALTLGLRPYLDLFHQLQGPAFGRCHFERSLSDSLVTGGGPLARSGYTIYHSSRAEILPPLLVRPAIVEDHDNLVEVFDAQSDVITDVYGQYFLAELIAAQDDTHKSLVAEPRNNACGNGEAGKAVGLMCLTSDVDVNILTKCFHLEDYDFLLKSKFAAMAHRAMATSGGSNNGSRRSSAGEGHDSRLTEGDMLQHTLRSLDLDAVWEALSEEIEEGNTSGGKVDINAFLLATLAALDEAIADRGVKAAKDHFKEALETLFTAELQKTSSLPIAELVDKIDAFLAIQKDTLKGIGEAMLAARAMMCPALLPAEGMETTSDAEGCQETEASAGLKTFSMSTILDCLQEGSSGSDRAAVLPWVLTLWGGIPQASVVEDVIPSDILEEAIMNISGLVELPAIDGMPSPVTPKQNKEESYKITLPASDDLWLADAPQSVKDVFCITMLCLDHQYQRQSYDFLVPAFSMFPDKKYCILTQPHELPQSNLLTSMFVQIKPKVNSTFHHVLYLASRNSVLSRLSGSPLLSQQHNPHWQVTVLPLSSGKGSLDWLKIGAATAPLGEDDRAALQSAYQSDEIVVVTIGLDNQIVAVLGVEMPPIDQCDPVEFIDMLRSCYDVEDVVISSSPVYKPASYCCRLAYWSVVPSLRVQTRRLLHMANTALGTRLMYTTIDNTAITGIGNGTRGANNSDAGRIGIYDELVHLTPRRLPAVKTIKRIPPVPASFADMDQSGSSMSNWQQREWVESEGGKQEMLLKEQYDRRRSIEAESYQNHEQCQSMKIITKSMMLYPKSLVNSRIVVVGASDAGLSMLANLLSTPTLHFTSLTLLAPGGINYFLDDELEGTSRRDESLSRLFKSQQSEKGLPSSLRRVRSLTASTVAFNPRELRRLMMDSRVRILDARMLALDKESRQISVTPSHLGTRDHNDLVDIPYDYLVLTCGLQEHALHSLNIRSLGVADIPDGYKHVNGCLSTADAALDDILADGSILLKSLMWNPLSYVVIYGRSLDAYCAIQGLLGRLVPPEKIILVLPPRRSRETIPDEDEVLPVDAFAEGDIVEEKLHDVLLSIGVRIHNDLRLTGVQLDSRERLCAVRLDGILGEEERPAAIHGPRGNTVRGVLENLPRDGDDSPPRYKITCRVLITADGHSIDPRVFACIHDNQLVYDGRLIVDNLFRTSDKNIFAAGTLCEFSRRYVKVAPLDGRKIASSAENTRLLYVIYGMTEFHQSLRQDKYNGREVGDRLAEAIVK
ncbi:hypothetical protein FOL47_007757, partial [Perkinsus chesapeaki]